MAQLININSTEFRRCNLSAIQSGGTWASIVPDANEIILISTANALTADGSGNCDAYIKGDGTTTASALVVKPVSPEIADIESDISDINAKLEGLPEVQWEEVNISSEYDSELSAYMNANNGAISAQAENLGRRIYMYRVTAGEKYHITGHLYASGTLYGFIGFYAGANAPVNGNTAQVIEAYAATAKDVDREIEITENGWLLVCMSNNTMTNRYYEYDWQVYRVTASGGFYELEAQINQNTQDIEELKNAGGSASAYANVSNDYDGQLWAYMNANTGAISAQAESTGRQLFLYKVTTGEKYKVTGELNAASAVYTFLGFFAGEEAPVVGNTGVVLDAYASTKISVNREISVTENGWIILGMGGIAVTNRYYGNDWQVYKAEAVDNSIGGLYLPKKLTAVVGDTIQIFKRSLFKGINPDEYDIMAKCEQGKDFPRYWQHTPTSAGSIPLKFSVKNWKTQELATASAELTIKAAPTSPSAMKRIAVFGDSLTQAGTWVAEAARRLLSSDAATATMPEGKHLSNIRFIGAMGTGNARYYGVGGWSWKSYTIQGSPAFRFQVTGVSSIVKGAKYTNNGHTYEVVENNTTNGSGNILCTTSAATNTPTASGTLTRSSGTGDATITFTSAAADAANPLWDTDTQAISFTKYISNIGESSVDCVVFLLGWNDMGANKTDFSELRGYMQTLVGALHTQFPSAIVKIMGLQLPSLNGGLAENYGSNGDYADKYGVIRTIFAYNEFLQSFCEQADYNSFVNYVDVASQFDSENNMPENSVQVNTRNAKTEERGTNGVHPANAGYYQIADVVYRDIVKTYC